MRLCLALFICFLVCSCSPDENEDFPKRYEYSHIKLSDYTVYGYSAPGECNKITNNAGRFDDLQDTLDFFTENWFNKLIMEVQFLELQNDSTLRVVLLKDGQTIDTTRYFSSSPSYYYDTNEDIFVQEFMLWMITDIKPQDQFSLYFSPRWRNNNNFKADSIAKNTFDNLENGDTLGVYFPSFIYERVPL